MHEMVDDIFLLSVRQIIEIQHIPKDDEEEQKELDLKKQYDLFPKEAEELHKGLEQLLDEPKMEDYKIVEALHLFKTRKEEIDHRFKKLESAGEAAIEGLKNELQRWKERESQEHLKRKEELDLHKAKDNPYKFALLTRLISLR